MWKQRMNEISLHENNEPDPQTRIDKELFVVFMAYYFYLEDINVLSFMYNFKRFY